MPAVRDYTFSYESTTADAGLTIPVCASLANDLLIAICMADTGALTTFTATPPTGWKILQEWYNTTPMIAYFKIASGSDTDLVVATTTHATTSETYNGSMVSIRDIDTVTPLMPLTPTNMSYASSNQSASLSLVAGVAERAAQSFVTPAATANTNNRGCFARARFYLKKVGSPTGNMTVKIYAHSGTFGTSSVPTGAALATSNTIAASTLTTSYQLIDFVFPESSWYQFAANTNYTVSLEYANGDVSNYVDVGYDSTTPTHGGNMSYYDGATWFANSAWDAIFEVQRFTFSMSNMSAAARTTMSTITTDRNDSLILYVGGGSGSAGTPSFIEGPITQIHGSDGAAESHSLGWTFKRTAGSTPNNVVCSMAVTGASVQGLCAANSPTSGATIVPGFVVTDNCTYIDPIAGTSAYNSNTALAATADTNFGTSLGGKTANDATVAASTDNGINSFHSLGGMTSSATAGTISGAELIVAAANRFNFSSKNLLCHIKPTTPAQLQRFTNIASGRGVWMGVRSNTGSGGATTGYKIWQVHGVDAPWGSGAFVPIIINNGAGDTKATSGTLDATVVTSVGFWVGSLTGLTCQMGFGSLWLMDSTVVSGGNSTEPLDIPNIVRAISTGKERVSAIQQGSSQLLLLQDLQIGDGGTNGIYLDLSATAIEFPRQYNASLKTVNYNSIDNKIGLKYYAGASDTIIHTNAIVSGSSRYFWGLHASSSASASYNFSGLQVIGAGTITLNKAITITSLTINNYSTIDVSDADLISCTITDAPSSNDSITSNASTSFTDCDINVSTVTAGNRLMSVANPEIFSGCTFTGGGGHAIRITTAGTYDLDGNTFNSFGSTGTNNAAIFNDSGGLVTLNITNGTSPTYRNGTSATTTVNNNVEITLTGLKANSEIRVYTNNAGVNDVVIDGIENSGTSFVFTVAASTSINIMINHLNYLPADIWGLSSGASNSSIPISQFTDRQYANT